LGFDVKRFFVRRTKNLSAFCISRQKPFSKECAKSPRGQV